MLCGLGRHFFTLHERDDMLPLPKIFRSGLSRFVASKIQFCFSQLGVMAFYAIGLNERNDRLAKRIGRNTRLRDELQKRESDDDRCL